MKSSTTMLVALGAVAVLGGVFALAAGGGGSGGGSLANPGRPGQVGGLKGASVNNGSGLTVDKFCGITIYDLPRAQRVAYNLGKVNSLQQAKALLYRAGDCGVTKPLKPTAAQMRSNYLVTYELLRGSVDGGQTSRGIAELALMDAYFAVAVAKVNTDGLPRNIP